MKTKDVVKLNGFRYRVTGIGQDARGRSVILLVRLFDASEWYAYRISRFATVRRIPDRQHAHLDPRNDGIAYGSTLY